MPIVEAAAGWGRNVFDRWKGMSSHHCLGSLENAGAEDMDIIPRTPLLKPIALAASSPPPLTLPPAMRSNLSPSLCLARASSTRNPRSPLAELKNDSNRCSSPDADGTSPSLSSRSRSGSVKNKVNETSPCLRGLSRTRSIKRCFLEPDADEKVAFKENNGEAMEKSNPVTVVSPFKRKRPAKLQIPSEPDQAGVKHYHGDQAPLEISVEGDSYGIYSKKGRHREVLEDAYQAVPDINGNSKQAFFGIFDGHGGRVAAEFAADHLSRNIRDALDNGERDLEAAVRTGYLSTDAAFLEKRVSSGASCVTAFIQDASLVIANAGDCRAVMSRNGVAVALTEDHRLAREDERRRVEDLGGYVDLYSGVWRLQGVLAVSRGIGDLHLKEWVSAEPEIQKLSLDDDCEFLVLASDGIWDVVSNQEAVDCVGIDCRGGLAASTKKLVELAASRGSQDDITVMVVNLRQFR